MSTLTEALEQLRATLAEDADGFVAAAEVLTSYLAGHAPEGATVRVTVAHQGVCSLCDGEGLRSVRSALGDPNDGLIYYAVVPCPTCGRGTTTATSVYFAEEWDEEETRTGRLLAEGPGDLPLAWILRQAGYLPAAGWEANGDPGLGLVHLWAPPSPDLPAIVVDSYSYRSRYFPRRLNVRPSRRTPGPEAPCSWYSVKGAVEVGQAVRFEDGAQRDVTPCEEDDPRLLGWVAEAQATSNLTGVYDRMWEALVELRPPQGLN
jgi:hypothetical protein